MQRPSVQTGRRTAATRSRGGPQTPPSNPRASSVRGAQQGPPSTRHSPPPAEVSFSTRIRPAEPGEPDWKTVRMFTNVAAQQSNQTFYKRRSDRSRGRGRRVRVSTGGTAADRGGDCGRGLWAWEAADGWVRTVAGTGRRSCCHQQQLWGGAGGGGRTGANMGGGGEIPAF